jgi:hypothetical protein
VAVGTEASALSVRPAGGGRLAVASVIGKQFLVTRYLADGSPDVSFGPAGVISRSLAGSIDAANAVFYQVGVTNKWVVAGVAGPRFVLTRYNEDLSLDPSFGENGSLATEAGGLEQLLYAVEASDGRIVAAGTRAGDFALVRYESVPSGTVMLSEHFDDPTNALLPQVSPDPRFQFAYAAGEYVIRKLEVASDFVPLATVPGVYGDASVAVDVRLVGETAGRYVAVACRFTGTAEYTLLMEVQLGRLTLVRMDRGTPTPLVEPVATTAINRGSQVNRVELRCVGDTITAVVNGTTVATARDSTYQAGLFYIAAGALNEVFGTAEGRFDNLLVTRAPVQAAASAQPSPSLGPDGPAAPTSTMLPAGAGPTAGVASATSAAPGTVLIADTFDTPEGVVPTGPSRISGIQLARRDGAYQITIVQPTQDFVATSPISRSLRDVLVAVDAQLVGDTGGRFVGVSCRITADSYYGIFIRPATRQFVLFRGGTRAPAQLATGVSPAINPFNEWNHLELRCAGANLTGQVNGMTIASAVDTTLAEGGVAFQVGIFSGTAVTAEARFDNFVVVQQ